MGLTDGHLAWGDDIPTESEKTYYRQIANLEKENARLLENLKIGHWIDDKCTVCGKGTEDLISSREWYRNEDPKFCPFCGVKIKEVEL